MNKVTKDIIYILGCILLLNAASYFVYVRWDFTSNKRYSLSKVSKDIIKDNRLPVKVDFYITEDLPQDMQKVAQEFLSLLKEYKSLSTVDFVINTIFPNSPAREFAAERAGVKPIYKEVREHDLEKVQRIFIGAAFRIGKQQAAIPQINFDTPLEYEITRLLKQANDTLKPKVGFVKGHREMAFTTMSQLVGELSHLSRLQFVDLKTPQTFESSNVLCIINPQEPYTALELENLEKYLERGGRLFVALSHAIGQLGNRNNGFINRTGVEDLLEKKGLKIKYDFIVDNNCGTIAIHQQYGLLDFQSNVSFPYIPIVSNFSQHTVTHGLKSLLLPFVSSIEYARNDSDYSFKALARTSAISGVQQAPIFFDFQKQWTQSDFNHPNNIVAALLTHEKNNGAIIAITNADFISNEIANSTPTDNISFAVNAIEWLADNSGLIQLRNKFTTYSLLDPITDYYRELLKYLNFLLPIVLTIVAAIVHYRYKKRMRMARSHPGRIE